MFKVLLLTIVSLLINPKLTLFFFRYLQKCGLHLMIGKMGVMIFLLFSVYSK